MVNTKENKLSLQIIAPDKELINEKGVNRISIRLIDGYLISIYPEHAPILAVTSNGPITYFQEDGKHETQILSGVVEVNNNVVSIYTEGELKHNDDTMSDK